MEKRGGGVIVNVIGTGALRPAAGFMIGGAVNAALNHFTKALADEGAKHGVRVVGVNPGPIMTERLRRFLPPGEERTKRCAAPRRWAAPASPKKSPTWWRFWPPIAPRLSTAPTSRSTAAPIPA